MVSAQKKLKSQSRQTKRGKFSLFQRLQGENRQSSYWRMSRRSAKGGGAQPRKKKPPAVRLSSPPKSFVLGENSFQESKSHRPCLWMKWYKQSARNAHKAKQRITGCAGGNLFFKIVLLIISLVFIGEGYSWIKGKLLSLSKIEPVQAVVGELKIDAPESASRLGIGYDADNITGGVAAFNGNVGIGTTGPGYKLDVVGTGRFTDNVTVSGISTIGPIYLNQDATRDTANYSTITSTPNLHLDSKEGQNIYLDWYGGGGGVFIGNGAEDDIGSLYAGIMYDGNDTGYYSNPASTSNVNVLTANGNINAKNGLETGWAGSDSNITAGINYKFGYQEDGLWESPYPDLILGYHTGVSIGGHSSYNGTRFFNDHPDRGGATEIFSVGKGDNHVRVVNNLYTAGNTYIDNTTNYLSYPTGQYGSIQINGGGKAGWEGFSIDGRSVFMHDGGIAAGIYNDVDDEWLFYGERNLATYMYYNGVVKIRTTNTGGRVDGNLQIAGGYLISPYAKYYRGDMQSNNTTQGTNFTWTTLKNQGGFTVGGTPTGTNIYPPENGTYSLTVNALGHMNSGGGGRVDFEVRKNNSGILCRGVAQEGHNTVSTATCAAVGVDLLTTDYINVYFVYKPNNAYWLGDATQRYTGLFISKVN